jgi:hypothetical protein
MTKLIYIAGIPIIGDIIPADENILYDEILAAFGKKSSPVDMELSNIYTNMATQLGNIFNIPIRELL